jgi:beta-xylosidase
MYYVARFAIGFDGTQCIGIATSDKPEGPFESPNPEPFICQVGEGGSIDPSTFRDEDGRYYMLWKNDGNSGGGQSWLYIQPVTSDGLALEGEPTRLLTADQPWEGALVEAPTLWKCGEKYYLFYSANAYNDQRYAVGYAVSDQILGPYVKAPEPILKTDIPAGLVGPGGQDIVTGPQGEPWILFHGWAPGGYRRLYLAPLYWENSLPVVGLKGKDPLPMP